MLAQIAFCNGDKFFFSVTCEKKIKFQLDEI